MVELKLAPPMSKAHNRISRIINRLIAIAILNHENVGGNSFHVGMFSHAKDEIHQHQSSSNVTQQGSRNPSNLIGRYYPVTSLPIPNTSNESHVEFLFHLSGKSFSRSHLINLN